MEPILGPTGINIYIAGVLPLVLAAGVLFFYWKEDRRAHLFNLPCSNRTFWLVLFGGALAAALGFRLLEYNRPVETLWDTYYARALNLVEYAVFGYGNESTAFFPPGYSMLLVPSILVLGHSKWAIFGTNMAVLFFAVMGLRWFLRTLSVREGLANFLSLFLLLYPTRFFSTYIPLSDIPFSLFSFGAFALMLLVVLKKRGTLTAILAGLFSGATALIRPNGLFFFIPILIGVVSAASPGARMSRCAIVCGAFVIMVLPWTLRNASLYGAFVPVSTNGGYNILAGNNPTREISGGYFPDVLLEQRGNSRWNEAQRDSFWRQAGIEEIARHPVEFVRLGIRKVIRTFSSDTHSLGALRIHTNAGHLPGWCVTTLYGLNNFLYYVFGFTLLVVLWRRWEQHDAVRWLFVLTAAIVAGTAFVLFGSPKYKEPLSTIAIAVLGVYLSAVPHGNRDRHAESSLTRSAT